MDVSKYFSVFMDECHEHLQLLNQGLLELENNPDDSVIFRIFRSAHTLKGASATMGFNKMAKLTHVMEDLLSKLRSKEQEVNSEIISVLFEAVDTLEILANKIADGKEEDIDISGVTQALNLHILGEVIKPAYNAPNKTAAQTEHDPDHAPQPLTAAQKAAAERRTVNLQIRYVDSEREQIAKAVADGMKIYHVDVSLVENCLLKSARVFMVVKEVEKNGVVVRSNPQMKNLEDEHFDLRFNLGVLSTATAAELTKGIMSIGDVEDVKIEEYTMENLPIEKRVVQTDGLASRLTFTSAPTVRVDIRKLDDLMNLVGELVISRSRLEVLGVELGSKQLNEVVEQVGRLTLDLQDNVLKARMVPVETVFSRFPRLIRDLSKELGKEIELEIYGGETELDRTLIDEIGDPLVHIIRNSVDHGIETPEERLKANKPMKGKIVLRAYQEGNIVVINVSDDGKGFNVEKVKEKALKLGLVEKEALEQMRNEQIFELTFLPGFSTAEKVTDVSGRGVGMDVVKTKVESLGGMVKINSEYGKGSTLEIHLPLTLAIIQTLMVQLGNEIYAIPSGYVEQIISLTESEVRLVRNQEMFMLRGSIIPLLRLQNILGTPDAKNMELEELDVVVLKIGERLVGCVVDALLRQQDVVIKSLGKYLGTIKGIAGATILGDGRVALIIDIRAVA
jgi:two-component system chemotaxis sensor kinase CheA